MNQVVNQAGIDRGESRKVFGQLAGLASDDPNKAELRNQLTTLHLPLAEHLARRFTGRGEPYEDLVQVATIGLIKAIDRFDPDRAVEFSTFATPTILGEIKRWFRDKGWAIRVPRRLQELRLSMSSVSAELTQVLGRSPTIPELSSALGVDAEEIIEALESSSVYSMLSLDAPDPSNPEGLTTLDTLGQEDHGLAGVENREALSRLLARLPERERQIIVLRFFRGLTQSQIAAEIGISQMHVSRLLSRTLVQLRDDLLSDTSS